MSNISQFDTGTLGGGGTESGQKIRDLGGLPSGRPPVAPIASGSGLDTGATPGTYSIQPFDPGASAAQALQESESGLAGLKNAIFGVSSPDSTGHHGGLVGDIPLLGDLGRGASEVVAGVGNAALGVGKGALDVAGGAMEHFNPISFVTGDAELRKQFDQLPDSVEKEQALASIQKDPGAVGHYMSKAIGDFEKRNLATGDIKNPNFFTGAFRPAASAADVVDDILGGLGLTSRLAERTWTGISTPGQGGMDRLGVIMAVGEGRTAFQSDKGLLGTGFLAGDPTTGLNHVEQIVYAKVKSGDWTPDQARDFLTASGSGYSHAAIGNIAGEIALDPQNFLSLGAVGISKVLGVGAKLAAGAEKAAGAVVDAEKVLAAAKAESAVAKGLDAVDAATKVTKAGTALTEAQSALEIASKGAYKIGGDVSKANVLGQAAQSERMTNLVRNLYKAYEPLQQVHVQKAIRVARAMIDPLGALSLHNPFRKQMIDLLSDDVVHTVIGAYGDGNHATLIHKLADATDGVSTPLADMFSEDLGTYATNLGRAAIARVQRTNAIAGKYMDRLMRKDINEVIAGMGDKVPRSFDEHVLRAANINRIRTWDKPALDNLAARLADNYGIKSPEEWSKWLVDEGLNADHLSMLHAATYGRATKRLLASVEDARKSGLGGDLANKLNRLILINRTTLTKQGATGIINDLEAIKGVDEQIAFIEHAQELYPELRGFTLDRTAPARTVERFTKDLSRRLDAFPMQVVDEELAQLPEDLKSIHTDATYTLGFAPEDEYKWGVSRSNTEAGGWAPTHDVWVDHVAPGLATGYRPASLKFVQNVAGQPVLGSAAEKLGRTVDYIDAGIRTMNRRISGAMIAESARESFKQRAVAQFGGVGITESVANDMINALEDAVRSQDIVVRPSGFSSVQMWKFIEDVIPKSIRPAEFGKRDLMNLVLEAYQGDMRHVGLTQALSSRIKRVLAFDSNNASVLAEQVYPILKYRLNAIFQAQEKIEPWVLNAFRGVTPAKSVRSLNEADKATQVLLERMAQRSLVSNADFEMAEYAGQVLHGKTIEDMAMASNTSLGRMTKRLGVDWAALRDVKGVKQVNMLRTFRKGLGKDLRASWDKVEPGLFDDMYAEAVRKAKRGVGGLSEDDFAVSIMAEQMLGSGVNVTASLENRLGKIARTFDKVDYKAAITPGEWMTPQTLGGLRSLDLDSMAELMAFPVGRAGAVTKTQADLRAAIAAGDLSVDDVTLALRRLNADPDYVTRVQSALNFSWTGFWDQVGHDFQMTPKQVSVYEDLIANAAELHDMTPIDYLSQVMVPTIGEGSNDPVIGHLGKIKELLDSKGNVKDRIPDLSGLRVIADKSGTEEDFVKQLSTIFAAHLDPSAKRALMQAFQPDIAKDLVDRYDISIEDINRLWTPEMDQQFAQHVLGEINRPTDVYAAWEAGQLKTVADFERVDPGVELNVIRADGAVIPTPRHTLLGDGLRNAPPEVQRDVLPAIGRFKAEFPGMRLDHVDIAPDMTDFLEVGEDPTGVLGVTLESSRGGDAVILNNEFYGPNYKQFWEFHGQRAEAGRVSGTFKATNPLTGQEYAAPRESLLGASHNALSGPQDTITHELSHVIDSQIGRRLKELQAAGRGRTKEYRMLNKYSKFRQQFDGSLAARRLSEYAQTNREELMAELGSVAFSSANEEEVLAAARRIDEATAKSAGRVLTSGGAMHGSEMQSLNDFGDFLTHVDANYPDLANDKTVAALTDILIEADQAEQLGRTAEVDRLLTEARKAGAMVDKRIAKWHKANPDVSVAGAVSINEGPQTVEDAVKQMRQTLLDAGIWKPAPAKAAVGTVSDHPDVIRAVQQFGRWTDKVLGNYIKEGGNAVHAGVLDRIAGIPTHQAVPYNFTEHKLMETAIDSMKSKWEDAHRLQYYARERTMLERSINHPMFGIYPASYMWGKMLPEMIRFMAKEPFGIHTGAMAYSFMDAQRAVAMQKEMDPEFAKKMDALGHSAAMYAVGYMLPTWPWEVNAAWPAWIREMSQEGLDMQARVNAGGTVATKASGSGINIQQVGGKAADLLNPMNYIDRAILNPIKEINPINPPSGQGAPDTSANPYFTTQDTGPVAAGDLGDPLSNALSSLRDLLGG